MVRVAILADQFYHNVICLYKSENGGEGRRRSASAVGFSPSSLCFLPLRRHLQDVVVLKYFLPFIVPEL